MKMHSAILLCIVSTLLLTTNNALAEEYCGVSNNFATRLTIDNHRTENGLWISQVELLHSDKHEDTGESWTVDVTQTTSKCDEISSETTKSNSFVALDATLFNPKKWRAPAAAGAATKEASWDGVATHLLTTIKVLGTPLGFSATPLPWQEARHVCRDGMEGGGDLFDLDGPPVLLIGRLLKEIGLDMAFVGLWRDAAPPHNFRTPSGHGLSPENRLLWSNGRPATKGPLANEACLTITKEGTLLDADCQVLLPFVCSPSATRK